MSTDLCHLVRQRERRGHLALFGALAFSAALGLTISRTVADDTSGTLIEVSVRTVSEEIVRARLVRLSVMDGLVIHAAHGADRRIPTEDLVRITTNASVTRRGGAESTFHLSNGDVVFGRPMGARDESVVVETVDLGSIAVPLESISRIDSERATLPAYRQSVKWLDSAGQTDEDRALLTNGDVVRGFVTGIDGDGVSIDSSMGETTLPHRLVVAVRLASTPQPPSDNTRLVLSFRASGRLTTTDLDWSGNVIQARLRDGQHLRIEAERITRIDVIGGRWEWLSTHRPISYQHTPMLSLGWEYANDRNVLGRPLRVAGDTFEQGVGVHSRSNLTYDLKGAYREFVTYLGIDDDSGPRADVSLHILVDGKRRFEQEGIVRGTLHGPVRLDVTRANRIELIVDFGKNGDLQDRFDWIEPALIRP